MQTTRRRNGTVVEDTFASPRMEELAWEEIEPGLMYQMELYGKWLNEGAIEPNRDRKVTDRFDDLPNSWIFGVYFDGVLAVRTGHVHG